MNWSELSEIIEKEGDSHQFHYKGYQCEVLRNPSLKNLCGYILVKEDHWLFGKSFSLIEASYDYKSHGGLTYSKKEGVLWKIGFDCAHSRDLLPYELEIHEKLGLKKVEDAGIYRDKDYVISQIMEMVDSIVQSY